MDTGNKMNHLKAIKSDLIRFMMSYKFALHEVNTKIDILKQEFQYIHDYNPIEHVKSRIKTPESILRKVKHKGFELSLPSIREDVRDIAGIRITCSFPSDIYEVSRMLRQQKDIEIIDCKDYIKNPKPNGYQSLHLVIRIPVFMSDRIDHIYVEIQIRTIAMDFWASLEHKIYYKYNKEIPQSMKDELIDAAETAAKLDLKMEKLHEEMKLLKATECPDDELHMQLLYDERFNIPADFLYPDFFVQKEQKS